MRKIFELAGKISADGLEAVQKGLKNIEGDLEKADKALTKFGRQSVKAGTTLTKYVTAPLVGLGATLAIVADRTGEYAHELGVLEQKSGLSKTALQEFDYVAKKSGISTETMAHAILMFSKNLSGTEIGSDKVKAALQRLGISINDAHGNMKSMDVLFPEFLSKLNAVPNVAQRNALAFQIFGRGAGSLIPVLKLSGSEIEQLRKRAHELGIVMSEDAVRAAEKYHESLIDLKAQSTALWRNLATSLFPLLNGMIVPLIQNKVVPLFVGFGNAVGSVIKFFTNLDPTMKKLILGFVAFIAILGPTLLAIGKSILIVKGLIAAFALLKTAFIGLTISMATNPFTALIAAAGVVVGALVGVKIWMDNVKKAAADREKLNIFGEEIEGLFNRMEARAGRGRMTLDMLLDLQKNSMVSEKALVQHLSAMAEDYGFIVSGNDAARIKQLKRISDLIKETGNITLAAKKYNEELAAEKTNTENANNAAAETSETLNKLQDEYAALTEGEIEGLERARDAEKTKATETIKDKKELNNALALIDDIYDEKIDQAQIKDAADRAAFDKDVATKQIEKEKEAKIKILEMQGDQVGLLKQQYEDDLKNFGNTEEKKAIIKAYYDKKIADAMKKEKKTTLDKWRDAIDLIEGYFSQLGDIYTAGTKNRIIENDNWYAKEKEAIEKSGLSAKKKEKKMEKLDEEYNAKRTVLRREQAKKEKAIAVFESIIATASAVAKALPNLVLSAIAGAIGALKTAFIIAQPLPLAAGGLAKKRTGGIGATIAEGSEDELVLPLKTGVELLADRLVRRIGSIMLPPLPALAMAGGGTATYAGDIHWHIGTLIADDRSIKELERRQSQFRVSEAQRKGRE